MAVIANDIDKALQATVPRYTTDDGAANFTWVRYADDAAGTNMSDSSTGKKYIGFAFNKATATESNVPTDYAWSLIQGTDGISTFSATVYVQQSAQPSAPTGGSYSFSSGVLTPPTGWSATRPGNTTTPTWSTQFNFTSAVVGATVTGGTWSGPVNAGQNGGAANLDPGALKDALVGQLTEDQLYTTLKSRIALIDGSASTPGSVAAQVKAETDARVAAIAQEVTDRTTYVQQWSYSKAASDQSQSAFGASIQAAYQGYADNAANSALTSAKAYSQSYSYSKADSDSAISASAQELRSEFQSLNGGAGATVAYVQQYTYSKAQADAAIASSTTQVSSRLNNLNGTGVTVEQVISAQASATAGLQGQYTIKIDSGGNVAGFGLASTAINGVPTSSFIVLADRFAVAVPGQTAKFPFSIGTVAGQQTIALNGNIIADGTFTARDAAGNVVLSTGTSLAQQVRANPNLCPTPQGMVMGGGAGANRNGDDRFGDGQYIWWPSTADSSYSGADSPPLHIGGGVTYTVSFDAYTAYGGTRQINADIFGTGVDSAGISPTITPTMQKFKFTETMPSGTNGDARLRLFTVAPGGDTVVLANIKVELGSTITPWCDSVITPANASTFIRDASINFAHINTATIDSLSSLSANFGRAHMSYGGGLSGGSYSSYSWPHGGGVTGFYLGPEGLMLGSIDDNRYFNADQFGNIYAPNFTIINGVPTFSNPVINSPTISNPTMNALSFSGFYDIEDTGPVNQPLSDGWNVSPSGGDGAPYKVSFSISAPAIAGKALSIFVDGFSCGVSGPAMTGTLRAQVTCTVFDRNGRSLTQTANVTFNYGTQ
jgi:hypothetical protein